MPPRVCDGSEDIVKDHQAQFDESQQRVVELSTQVAVQRSESDTTAGRLQRRVEQHEDTLRKLTESGDVANRLETENTTQSKDLAHVRDQLDEAELRASHATAAHGALEAKAQGLAQEIQRMRMLHESGLNSSNLENLMQSNLVVAEQIESFMRHQRAGPAEGGIADYVPGGGAGGGDHPSH